MHSTGGRGPGKEEAHWQTHSTHRRHHLQTPCMQLQLHRTHHDEWPLQFGWRITHRPNSAPSRSSFNAALLHLLPAGASLYDALGSGRLLVYQPKLQAPWAQLAGKQGVRRHPARGSCMGDYEWWCWSVVAAACEDSQQVMGALAEKSPPSTGCTASCWLAHLVDSRNQSSVSGPDCGL